VSNPAKRPVGQQSRREAIIAAAEAVFADHGYDRARLEDVARKVGIQRPSLLYHFHDKATLYGAVLDAILEDLVGRYARVLAGKGSTGERLERTVDEWLRFTTERPALLRIMLREMADGVSEHSRRFARRARALMTSMSDVVAAGQADHSLRQVDAGHMLMIIAGASTFLTLGGSVLNTTATERFPALADREQHRQLLLTMLRKLLGTSGPRPTLRELQSKAVGG